MKIIKAGIVMSTAVLLIACGGNANKSTETDASVQADSTAVEKQTLAAGSYTDENLGYSITYPKDILILQPETQNTDEQVFLYKDGEAKLRIYKDERKAKDGKILSFNEAFEADRGTSSKRQVSYSSLKPLFFVVSGVDNGKEIFYQKTIMSKGVMVTAKLTYTKEEKPVFDAMIASLFDSFR